MAKKSSDGFRRTGFANWIDYNDQTDTIRYGNYTFNPTQFGLRREKYAIDPATLSVGERGRGGGIGSILAALGADPDAISKALRPMTMYAFGKPNGDSIKVFHGDDAWKNQVAEQLRDLMNPPRQSGVGGLLGMGAARNQQQDHNGWREGGGTPAATGLYANIGNMTRKSNPTYATRVYKGDDGMYYYEYKDLIPDSQEFAQSVADKTWETYNAGVDMRYGKSPYSNKDLAHGKTPSKGLLA